MSVPPSRSRVQTSKVPERSEAKARILRLGERCGASSKVCSEVHRVEVPLAGSRLQMSGPILKSAYAILVPSRDTARLTKLLVPAVSRSGGPRTRPSGSKGTRHMLKMVGAPPRLEQK